VVGDRGTVVEWETPDTLTFHDIPGKPFLKTVSWHSSGDYALIGGGEGKLFRYESGEITRISQDIDWTIHDLAWHPTGEYALLVGGLGAEDRGYWGLYDGSTLEHHQLSRTFFSVEWINSENALLAGQRVIWRYSHNQSPENFELRASLSTSQSTVRVDQEITLSGFGSTYRANADSIVKYGFRYDQGDTVRFQEYPDHNVRYERPGNYRPELIVQAEDGSEEAVDSSSITVKEADQSNEESSTVPLNAFVGFLLVIGGGLVLIGLLYWQVGDVAEVDEP